MKVFLCSISFRHHLLSLEDLARWAAGNDFQGIELWGAHGRNVPPGSPYGAEWLAGFGLTVPMVSDYLPTEGCARAVNAKAAALCRLAQHWGAGKIRTFAGTCGSAMASQETRRTIAARLRGVCGIAADHGLRLLIETHPGTLADGLASTLQMIEEVNHPALGINFDTLHVWEGGDDPLLAHRALKPHIGHYHLKNIRARADLSVFEPANVYAAAGRRDGMTPLFDGAVDYAEFLTEMGQEAEASLEWFGDDGFAVLSRDRRLLRHACDRARPPEVRRMAARG